jgi:mRNA interferase MazF
VEAKFLQAGVSDVQNLVTIPYVKLIKKLGVLSSKQLLQIEEALCLWLGL